MIKNQNKSFYFICLFFVLSVYSFQSVQAQNVSNDLNVADSLFSSQKYTESFEIYETILNTQEQASPRMLLKMAFIKEGLGDYSNALYYLNLYYLKTSDKKARNKMQEIAKEHELSGFELSDTDFFLGLIRKYYIPINVVILGVILVLGGVLIFRKLKYGTKSYTIGFTMLAFLFISFYTINFATDSKEGIIMENHAYIMSGPSAGANLVEIVQKGHRIQIQNDDGVWAQVSWNGKSAFIRSNKIRKLG